jgi:hypothetical protein
VIFQASCNLATHPCGCAEWDERDEGNGWVHKRWVCWRHESAATTEGAALWA